MNKNIKDCNKIYENYNVFDPGVDSPLDEVSRKEAKEHFILYTNSWNERKEELQKVLNHFNIQPDCSDESIEKIDKIFDQLVCPDKKYGLLPETFSICNDLSLYLAQCLFARCKGLKWELDTAKRSVSYQRPVITGFDVPNKKFSYDFDDTLCRYSFWILSEGKKEGKIKKLFNGALSYCKK